MESVRSWLFSPLTRPDRCLAALRGDADQAIWDLEDSVGQGDKSAARHALRDLARSLTREDRPPWVRINALGTPAGADDIACLEEVGLRRVVLPKVDRESVACLANHAAVTDWLLLVETARSIYELQREPWPIPSSVSVRLAFGALDYRVDIGARATGGEAELLWAQSAIVFLSRVHGWPGPIDAVYPQYRDTAGLTQSATRSYALGFAGKLAIHPDQIAVIRDAFTPSEDDRRWARAVLEAVERGQGVVSVGGMMVDRPVIERARRMLQEGGSDSPKAP
ncbi:MAG: HpcH/HpaI aldolase/citrate lyase family protein [Clostridia bacterium]